MNGLGAATGQPEQQMSQQNAGEMQASPEEQALYDEIVGRALLLIFDEKGKKPRENVLQMLEGDEPKQALAETAATIYFRVLQEAAKAGIQVSPDIHEAAGAEVFETLAEIASRAGIHDFINDNDAFEGAFYLAADELRRMEEGAGMIDQEAAKQSLMEADKSGEMDAIMQQMGGAQPQPGA